MNKDINSMNDIQLLVDKFYEEVQHDSFIGPIFNQRLAGSWEMHHKRLYSFWNTILFRNPDYSGDPVPVHFNLDLNDDHFDHWLALWIKTVDDNFEGKIAEKAKLRGKTMADSFMRKIKNSQEL